MVTHRMQAGESVADQVPREGEGVEDVPEVHDEHGDRNCRQWLNAGDHADKQQFKRAGERRQSSAGATHHGKPRAFSLWTS
jgi:hypothetical protein